MIWNLEPQQMLYVTAVVSVYGAILSTFNLLREQCKDRIRLEIVASNAFLETQRQHLRTVVSINVVNNSTFEIEITSLGFILDSGYKLVFMDSDMYSLPDNILSKKSKTYCIEDERLKKCLTESNISGIIKMKPFVMVNNKLFAGKPFYFNG